MLSEEQDLIKRIQEEDTEAFREIVERYYKRVYSITYGFFQDREKALDAVQEVFIKTFRSIGGFRFGSSFYTWLYRITINVCIDLQRRSKSAPFTLFSEIQDEEGAIVPEWFKNKDSLDPQDDLLKRELRAVTNKAILSLSPEHRAVIILREIEGLSYKEIARAMNCSEGTVMSRLHYARKRLMDLLKGYLKEGEEI